MTNSPHDGIFKAAFSDPQHAAAELRHILPASVVRALDWNSLRLMPGSYVDEALASRHSDLLFSANIEGRPAFVYLLFEHQRTNDLWMALRLLAYMVRIWERHVFEHPKAKLPLIIPAVLSQVDGGWSAPRRFSEVVDVADANELRAMLPDFSYEVDDLGLASDDELAARGLADFPSLALWLMRDVWDPAALLRGLERRTETIESLLRGPNGGEYLIRLLRYLALAAEGLPRERFYAKLTGLVPSTESYAMTIAEELRREGEARGEARRGRTALLVVLEARGFSVSEEIRAKVEACEDAEQLTDWTRRAVTVGSIDELLD